MSFRTLSAILRGAWLIEPQFVHSNMPQIVNLIKGQNVDFGLTEREEEKQSSKADKNRLDVFAGTKAYKVGHYTRFDAIPDGSVAIVNLLGPVLKYGDACSYGMVDKVQLLNQIDASGKFKSIVLNIDSPGGQAQGTQMLADTISNLSIPVIAVVDDGMMASAAMWIGSACDEIYATKATDRFGSIGVYTTLYDFSGLLEQAGIVEHEIYAPQSKDKNKAYHDALAGDYELIQSDLSDLASAFIGAIKENRGSKINTKNGNPFTGKMFSAEDAIAIGLIDGIASFQEVLSRADAVGSNPSSNLSKNQNTMFGNKFPKLSALKGKAAASLTQADIDPVNTEIADAEIEGVTLVLDSELATHADSAQTITDLRKQLADKDTAHTSAIAGKDAEIKKLTDKINGGPAAVDAPPAAQVAAEVIKDSGGDKPEKTSVDAEADAIRAQYAKPAAV